MNILDGLSLAMAIGLFIYLLVALLRADRQEPTALSRFWTYAGALQGVTERGENTAEYSRLMAASQLEAALEVVERRDDGAAEPEPGLALVAPAAPIPLWPAQNPM